MCWWMQVCVMCISGVGKRCTVYMCVGVGGWGWAWVGCRCDCEVPLFLQLNELTRNINETSLRVEKVKCNLEFILVCAQNQGKGLSCGYSLFPRPSSPPLVLLLLVSKYGGGRPGRFSGTCDIRWTCRGWCLTTSTAGDQYCTGTVKQSCFSDVAATCFYGQAPPTMCLSYIYLTSHT